MLKMDSITETRMNFNQSYHNMINHNNNCDQFVRIKGYPVNRDKITDNQDTDCDNYPPINDDLLNGKVKLAKSVRDTVFDDVNGYFDQLSMKLEPSTISPDQKEMESLIVSLRSAFNQMLSTSVHYEYKNLPANGFVTYCIMVRSWLIKCIQKLNDNNQLDSATSKRFINDIYIVLKGFLLVRDMLVHFHQTQLNHRLAVRSNSADDNMNDNDVDDDGDQGGLPLFSSTIDETIYQLENCFQATEFQEALARSFSLFWLSPRSKLILKLYQKGISWTYSNFLKSWRVLTNKQYRCKTFIKLANRANMGFPVDVAAIIDGHLSRKVCRNILYRNKDAVGTNFWIKRQGRWFVPPVGPGIIEKSPPTTDRSPIRCRFIKHRYKPVRTDVMIFHCHGSGFILSRPDIHDAYLKPWVAQLDGVSILSIDYGLMAPYPEQFQDVLDAYLWVTSGEDSVIDKIGFNPKKIVLIGDSAGSMLSISIPLLLHEIGKQTTSLINNNRNDPSNNHMAKDNASPPINMPVGFMSFYGTFQLTGAWSSSRIMSIFDPILHYGNVLAIAGCLSGIQGKLDDSKEIPKNRFAKVSSYIAEDIKLVKRTVRPRRIHPWYINDGQIATDRFNSLFERLQSPYLNCPSFDSYEALKDMSLCLITSFGCIFLDDNIELARSWKGQCEVHVLEGQIHGFLFMRHEKAAIKFANDKVIQFVNKFVD